jgi:hypothetical protein
MIICPLSSDECSKRIILRPKTVFLMTPSKSKRNAQMKIVISSISSELIRNGLIPLDGCSLFGLGSTVCKICSTMQGCPISISFYNPDVDTSASCNIFWEMGMMQGWGRPATLVANNKTDLPSDFLGEFCLFYEQGNYLRKITQLIETFKEREPYYVNTLAAEAIDAVDFEKAIIYLEEAYLISGNRQIITKLRKLKRTVKAKHISIELKDRLNKEIDKFDKDSLNNSK